MGKNFDDPTRGETEINQGLVEPSEPKIIPPPETFYDKLHWYARCVSLFALLPLSLSAVLWYLLYEDFKVASEIVSNGIVVVAKVTEIRKKKERDGRILYWPVFEYEISKGTIKTTTGSGRSSSELEHKVGDREVLFYDPVSDLIQFKKYVRISVTENPLFPIVLFLSLFTVFIFGLQFLLPHLARLWLRKEIANHPEKYKDWVFPQGDDPRFQESHYKYLWGRFKSREANKEIKN